MGPLQGIKIIDMTTVLMGPYATQMLGDYGADVIKVESLEGDVTRLIGPTRHPGMGPVFLNTNRNKRSIALDLKKPSGREVVLRLVEHADVLIYNVRPQAMARLQLGYDVVSAINPRLVYAGVFGFGQDGPYAAKPAMVSNMGISSRWPRPVRSRCTRLAQTAPTAVRPTMRSTSAFGT